MNRLVGVSYIQYLNEKRYAKIAYSRTKTTDLSDY